MAKEYNTDLTLNFWCSEEDIIKFAQDNNISKVTEGLVVRYFERQIIQEMENGAMAKKILTKPIRVYKEYYRDQETVIPMPTKEVKTL